MNGSSRILSGHHPWPGLQAHGFAWMPAAGKAASTQRTKRLQVTLGSLRWDCAKNGCRPGHAQPRRTRHGKSSSTTLLQSVVFPAGKEGFARTGMPRPPMRQWLWLHHQRAHLGATHEERPVGPAPARAGDRREQQCRPAKNQPRPHREPVQGPGQHEQACGDQQEDGHSDREPKAMHAQEFHYRRTACRRAVAPVPGDAAFRSHVAGLQGRSPPARHRRRSSAGEGLRPAPRRSAMDGRPAECPTQLYWPRGNARSRGPGCRGSPSCIDLRFCPSRRRHFPGYSRHGRRAGTQRYSTLALSRSVLIRACRVCLARAWINWGLTWAIAGAVKGR